MRFHGNKLPFKGFRRWLSLLSLLALAAVPLACGKSSPDVDPSADNAAALPSPSAAALTPTATPPAPTAPTPVPSDVLAPSLATPLTWAADPPDSWHSAATEALETLRSRNLAMAREVEGMAWLADGVTEGEFYQLSKAVDIASTALRWRTS